MSDMGKVMAWAGFTAAEIVNNNTVTGSLASLLGVTSHVAPRVIGIISEADYESVIARWKIPQIGADGNPTGGGVAPTMAQLGAAKLVGRACRIVAGNGATLEELKAVAAAAKAAPVPLPSSPSGATSTAAQRKVKLSAVLSQVDDSEIEVISEKEILKGYLRYETLYGKGERPPKDSEPTAEQVSSLLHLINQGHPPYADFATLPYSARMVTDCTRRSSWVESPVEEMAHWNQLSCVDRPTLVCGFKATKYWWTPWPCLTQLILERSWSTRRRLRNSMIAMERRSVQSCTRQMLGAGWSSWREPRGSLQQHMMQLFLLGAPYSMTRTGHGT